MRRESLPSGTILNIQYANGNKKYRIGQTLGTGAHCIVYEGISISDGIRVRIKECFPARADLSRKQEAVSWIDEDQRQRDFSDFRNAVNKQIEIQNNDEYSNSFSHILEIGEANGTLYSILDINIGKTFDQDSEASLPDILQTLRALAIAIGQYHKNGYLHLDIKPENFMVIPETREHIILLDADSIISKKDLQEGRISCIPYSEGWAAPEQRRCRIQKISEKTDIYAIGVILFERIMKRMPDSDDIGIYPEWKIPREIIKQYGLRAAEQLEEILRKTATVSLERRYSSMRQLAVDLRKTYDLSINNRTPVDREVLNDFTFVGRERELTHLHELLQGETNVVFIHGFGGVGKSSLVKEYVQRYKTDYEHTYFDMYDCDKGLKQYIEDIPLRDSVPNVQKSEEKRKGESFEEKIKDLATIATSKMLFIIDNFDVDDDEVLSKVLSLKAKFIFTSRNDHILMESRDGKICQMELECMDTDILREIFKREYKGEIFEDEIPCIDEIIQQYDNFTMIVPLIARYLYRNGIEITEFADQLKEEGLSSFGEEYGDVKDRKDGKVTQNTLIGHMKQLFHIMDLPLKQRQVLANLRDLRDLRAITPEAYRKYTQTRSLSALNDLIDAGIVQQSEENIYDTRTFSYTIHPIIAEIIDDTLNESKYHSDIIRYVDKQLSNIDMNPCSPESRDNIGATLLLSLNLGKLYDEDKIYGSLLIFFRQLFKEGELNCSRYLEKADGFSKTPIAVYYIIGLILKLLNADQINNKQEMIETASFTLIQDTIVVSSIGTFLWLNKIDSSYNIQDLCVCSVVFKLYLQKYKNSIFQLKDRAIRLQKMQSLFHIADVLILNFSESVFECNKWTLSEKNTILILALDKSVDVYFEIAQLFYGLSKLSFAYSIEKRKTYAKACRDMMTIFHYFNGEYINPYLLDDENPKKLWNQLKVNKQVESDLDRKVTFDLETIEALYFTNHKAWGQKLGESVWKTFACAEVRYKEMYHLLLDWKFLISQPDEVQKNLFKKDLPNKIWTDERLTSEEKQELLVDHVSWEVISINWGKSEQQNRKKFSIILNIYMNCLYKYDEYMKRTAELDEIHYTYFKARSIINAKKYIKDEKISAFLAEVD